MCTRYYLSSSTPELQKIISDVKVSPLSRRFITGGSPVKTEGEIRPMDVVPVLAPNPRGEETVFPMKWGYTNSYKGGKLIPYDSLCRQDTCVFRRHLPRS